MVAIAIISMVGAAIGTLTQALQVHVRFSEGRNTALQHARVTLSRIQRVVNQATASEQFPGAVVFADTDSGWRYPETLVVWCPTGTAVDPDGLPRFRELKVYCPHPTSPQQLLEITAPSDSRTVPALTNTSTWATELTALKTGNTATRVVLTEMVRTGSVGTNKIRAAVRFEVERRPSATQWSSYRAGTTAWTDVNWVQDVFGAETGLAQTWVRMELQIVPAAVGGTTAETPLVFFGSGAVYYELRK